MSEKCGQELVFGEDTVFICGKYKGHDGDHKMFSSNLKDKLWWCFQWTENPQPKGDGE